MRLRHSLIFAALALGLISLEARANAADHAYPDSFGNLVVQSSAGYKRIIVGAGHRGAFVMPSANVDASAEPSVLYDGAGTTPATGITVCTSRPMFWRGRDRMYGLPDGEVPAPPVYCR